MKNFSRQAVIPPTIAVTGFVIVFCLLLFSFVKSDMVDDAIERETHLTETIVKSARFSMLKSDRETLKNTIENIGTKHGVEHVRIFNKKGMIMFSANPAEVGKLLDKKEAGCIQCHSGATPKTTMGRMDQARRFSNEKGKPVLAITAPILNEKACSACHVTPEAQKILGTLDVGLSEEPLTHTLSTLRWQMIIFCILVGIVTVGGISALLTRNVLTPMEELFEYTRKIDQGDLDAKIPDYKNEIGTLAKSYHQMASDLKKAQKSTNTP